MMRVVLAMAVAVVIGLSSASARADTTYEIENVDAYPDKVFVAWPRTCGSTGDPLGAVSLQLNPDWVARQHEVDYEVIEKGKRHEVLPYCLATMRIRALPAAGFPRAGRVATADDASLGKKPGETLAILPALDAIELPKRIPFFASDPRSVTSPLRFDEMGRPWRQAKSVHVVLAIDPAFTAQPKRVVYTYNQDDPETVSYPLAGRGAAADAGADADADAGVVPTAVPTPPPSRDMGTRWVYAAAKKVGFPRGAVVRPLWPAPAFRRSSAVPGLAPRIGVGLPMLRFGQEGLRCAVGLYPRCPWIRNASWYDYALRGGDTRA